MTTWFPRFNGEECGCVVEADNGTRDLKEWKRCKLHEKTDFKELKRLSIEDNLATMTDKSDEEIGDLRMAFYAYHGIEHGL